MTSKSMIQDLSEDQSGSVVDLRSTTVTVRELTSESPVYSLDSPENHSDPSLLNPAGCSHSGPGVSGGRGWTSELRPEKNS